MKTFNEWLKDKNLEEGMADYTPGFIRRPLQRMGVMGQTSYEKEQERLRDKRAANDAEDMAKERQKRAELEKAKERELEQWRKDLHARNQRTSELQDRYAASQSTRRDYRDDGSESGNTPY